MTKHTYAFQISVNICKANKHIWQSIYMRSKQLSTTKNTYTLQISINICEKTSIYGKASIFVANKYQ